MVKFGDGGNPIPDDERPRPPEILTEPGQEPKPPPELLDEPGHEAPRPKEPPPVLREPGQGPEIETRNDWGCTPKAAAAVAVIAAVLVAIWFGLGNRDNGSEPSSAPTASATTSEATTTTGEAEKAPTGSTAGFAPPDPASLPAGTVLLTGTSGDQIGHISQDGQSRFLHLERSGVGVGNATMTGQSIPWPADAKVTGFGVDLDTSSNPGRYGINVFVPPSTYNVGCAIEKGELGCTATADNIKANVPIAKGTPVTLIIGEEGNLEAKGAFTLSWWLTYQPT